MLLLISLLLILAGLVLSAMVWHLVYSKPIASADSEAGSDWRGTFGT